MPDPQTLITSVLKEVPDTITINHATVIEDSKLATAAIRSCYGPAPFTPCDEATAITSVVEEQNGVTATLPTFMTLRGDVLTVTSTDNADSRSYTLEVTHSTVDEGPLTFNTVTIILNVCEITDLDPPTAPVDWWHWVHNGQGTVDISSPGFQQRPACGYTLIEDFEWILEKDGVVI